MRARYQLFDPFLSTADAAAMLNIAERYTSFGTYADEATSEGLGETLPQRFDASACTTGQACLLTRNQIQNATSPD